MTTPPILLAAVCDACCGTGRGMEDERDGYAHSTGRPCFACRGSGRIEFIAPDPGAINQKEIA